MRKILFKLPILVLAGVCAMLTIGLLVAGEQSPASICACAGLTILVVLG